MSENKFYLTTPIYYVNARPHIGHAYTTIVADVLARRHRLLGEDTFFLTGTDEHGQKIERSAAAAGIPPQQFADGVSKSFEDLWKRMGITNNAYIRTTSDKHKRGVQHLFAQLYERGFIYLASYTGSYCVSDEAFVDAPVGTPCPDCGRLLEEVTEENFFFKLSAFQRPLLDLIESDTIAITPESRKNEVLSFLRGNVSEARDGAVIQSEGRSENNAVILSEGRSPKSKDPDAATPATTANPFPTTNLGTPYVPGALKDLSISRSSFTWGIPVPEPAASAAAQKHVIYVWLDALANYMTAIGYGSDDPADQAQFKQYWPADLHLVGKEIIRFHCVYWPAFLLALNPEGAQTPGAPEPALGLSKRPASETRVSTETQGPQLTFDQHKAWAEKWLPKAITAHGWLLFDDSKMSKSKGNIVRTETILDAFGTLCPPPLPIPSKNSVIPSETQSAQKDAAIPSETQSAQKDAVILSEAAGGSSPAAQSKDPEALGPATTAETFSTENPTKAERDLFASDVLRYFLLREIPFGQDGSFSFDALITRYNADLANGYGNLVSRTLNMISQYFFGAIPKNPSHSMADYKLAQFGKSTELDQLYSDNQFQSVLSVFAHDIARTDIYISSNAPWKLAKETTNEGGLKLAEILYTAAESIRIITALLYPILPYATARVWTQLGLGDIKQAAADGKLKNLQWGGLKPGTKLGPLGPIFPRADKGLAQIMTNMENPTPRTTEDPQRLAENEQRTTSTDPAAPLRTVTTLDPGGPLPVGGSTAHTTGPDHAPSHANTVPSAPFNTVASQTPITASPTDASPQIAIDDFAKIELRVAQILIAERIPKADKLLRLEVDLGPFGKRQILSGIAEWYTPEDLIGRRIVVITNLAPRKMRGLESHGMLLAASNGEGGKPILATFAEDIALGSRLK